LRRMGVASDDDNALFDRAFVGMKRLYYRGGVASNCRGTATGVDTYYRTRPMGYYDCSLFAATMAPRLELAPAAGRG
jgi:hypothetical protein